MVEPFCNARYTFFFLGWHTFSLVCYYDSCVFSLYYNNFFPTKCDTLQPFFSSSVFCGVRRQTTHFIQIKNWWNKRCSPDFGLVCWQPLWIRCTGVENIIFIKASIRMNGWESFRMFYVYYYFSKSYSYESV